MESKSIERDVFYDGPLSIYGQDVDLNAMNSEQIMEIAQETGYAWLIPISAEKRLYDSVHRAIKRQNANWIKEEFKEE